MEDEPRTDDELSDDERIMVTELANVRSDRVKSVRRFGTGWLVEVFVIPADLEE